MPPQAGESTVLTLFADIHYFFAPPTQRPHNHRFEKDSYVYLYHEQSTGAARVEAANNPGTQHQDAFDGSLELADITYNHKHPSLVTFTIHQSRDRQWHLKSLDVSQQHEPLSHLHAVEMYFWTEQNASRFIDAIRRVRRGALNESGAAQGQIRTQEATAHNPPPGRDDMSPVVQKLEQVAVDAPYEQQHSNTNSISTTQSFLPPPPPGHQPPSSEAPAAVAYNPAAPAAPEPLSHRENTPPPVEGPVGQHQHQPNYGYNPNAQSPHQQPMYQPQQASQFSPPPSAPAHQTSFSNAQTPSFSPPPPSAPAFQTTFPPPPPGGGTPPSASVQRTSSFQQYQQSPASPGMTSPQGASTQQQTQPPAQRQSSFSSTASGSQQSQPQQQPQHRPSPLPFQNYASPPSSPPAPAAQPQQQPAPYNPSANATPLASPGAPPLGGYSTYSYSQPQSQQQTTADPNAIHSQLYKPTEQEAAVKGTAQAQATAGQGQAPGKLEQRADKLGKGVNKWLKKLDEKF
ncbi:MAG: hypothetical protein M1831_006598 [Alyxoria varia]|nr:MAG: hypothetical protein M1831_006598 [Alyxoria varia]